MIIANSLAHIPPDARTRAYVNSHRWTSPSSVFSPPKLRPPALVTAHETSLILLGQTNQFQTVRNRPNWLLFPKQTLLWSF